MKEPVISPYGHVLDYSTWLRILNSEPKNTCPFTKQHLTRRMLTKLTRDNLDEFKSFIIDAPEGSSEQMAIAIADSGVDVQLQQQQQQSLSQDDMMNVHDEDHNNITASTIITDSIVSDVDDGMDIVVGEEIQGIVSSSSTTNFNTENVLLSETAVV
jgi:hypothetical protein